MAIKANAEDPIIIGNDHQVKLENVIGEDGQPFDMSAWGSVKWFLRRRTTDTVELFAKTAGLIGVFDTDPAVNSQAWVATLTDLETETLTSGKYFFAWKLMDDGIETDLAYGEQLVVRTASR